MSLLRKVFRLILLKIRQAVVTIIISSSIIKYKLLSFNQSQGTYKSTIPILFMGYGKIFLKNVNFGVQQSPNFFNSYGYIEARLPESIISIGDGTFINNNPYIIAEKTEITIGDNCLIGINFNCIDSDFHGIEPPVRRGGHQKCAPVNIENNVFIGNNVTILKGVIVGENSVIANGSVVVKSIPKKTIFGGNPAKYIRDLVCYD